MSLPAANIRQLVFSRRSSDVAFQDLAAFFQAGFELLEQFRAGAQSCDLYFGPPAD